MNKQLYSLSHFLKGSVKNRAKKFLIAPAACLLLLAGNPSSAQTASALDFDGVDDLVSLPFVVSGSYTKEAWVYPTALGSFYNIASGENTALYINAFNFAGGNVFPFTAVADPTPISINTWYHVAITYNDATKLLSLYTNGVLVDDSVLTSSYTETTGYLGAVQYFGNPVAFFAGQMDELRFWNYARTGAQIAGNMNCNLTGDEPGLTAYYKFNQNIANGTNTGMTTLADSSDKCVTLPGTLQNFALTGTTSNWVSQAGAGTGVAGTCSNNFANISISGNSVCITDGDATPTTTDHTDFGMFAGVPIFRTFTITNTGNTTLTVSPVFRIASNASFNITMQPASTVAPGGSTTFQIAFVPVATGTSTAVVYVNNSDGDEGGFNFVIQGNSVVLPVELSYFRAEKNKEMSKLVWQTSSEHNNRGFDIQRSADAGLTWETIGFVAAGTSSNVNNYNFTDRLPLKGSNAYRLKQVDFDGRFKFSNIIVLSFASVNELISIYPNPVKDKLSLIFNDKSLLNTTVQVSSVTGRIVSRIKLAANRQDVDMAGLPKGIYLLSFDNGEVKRIVKQ